MVAPAKSRKRARYHHGNLPAALVEAATELIEESDLDALTLRAVARKVGVTHAAPYRHFRDKAALLGAVAAAGFEALGAAMARQRKLAPAPAQGLAAAGRAYLDFAITGAARFRLMFADERGGGLGDGGDASSAVVLSEIERAVATLPADARTTSAAEQRQLALSLWAQWHGLAVLALRGALPHQDAAELLAQATRSLARRAVTRFELSTVPAASVTEPPPRQGDA